MAVVCNLFVALASLEFLAFVVISNYGRGWYNTYGGLIFLTVFAMVFTYPLLCLLLVATGKMDGLWLPRFILYPGSIVTGFCLVLCAFLGVWVTEISQSALPEAMSRLLLATPGWALPALMVVLPFFMLRSQLVPQVPILVPRVLFFVVGLASIVMSLMFFDSWANVNAQHEKEIKAGLEASEQHHKSEMQAKIEQTDARAEAGFAQLLEATDEKEPKEIRELAAAKLLSAGPQFAHLLGDQLKTGDFSRGLAFLRDNDPPAGQASALAAPARVAMTRTAAWIRNPQPSIIWATDFERFTSSILKVANQYSSYSVDYTPAVRDYRDAVSHVDAASKDYIPNDTFQRLDAWLADKGSN